MYSLLIAEDELTTRRGLVNMVKWNEIGFRVDGEFSDGEELLDYLKSNMPDVILTDIRMSRVSGLEIARFVAENSLPVQVVFLSGYKDFEYAQSAVEYRVVHYLVKPVSLPKLREVFGNIREKLDYQKQMMTKLQMGKDAWEKLVRLEQTEDTSDESEKIKEEEKQYSLSGFENVMAYIKEHYCEDITLSDIAENVYLNPIYISRLIKEQTGKNYTDLLMELRIERAVVLLKTTQLYVYEIADKVGYRNTKYFYKVFKKVTGKSPNDYRGKSHE